MLAQLTIQNFGLIDNLSAEFTPRLNILTGATGAGKSIIIDALCVALGDRLKTAHIRDEAKPCLIEAVFELNKELCRHPSFADFLPEKETTLIISRQSFADGRNKIKINGFNVTVAQLKTIGDRLVDFHGPNDHQMLLSSESHLGILDQLTDFGASRNKYDSLFGEYSQLLADFEKLQSLASSRERDLDLLEHQVKELAQVPLDQQKYDELAQDLVKVNNAEKLYAHGRALLDIFESDDAGVAEMIRKAFTPMRALSQVDEAAAKFEQYLDNLQTNSEQLAGELRDYLDSLSFRPDEAEEISRQCDIYDDIKRKYGPSLDEAKVFFEEAKKKQELLQNFEHNDAQLKENIKIKEKELAKAAQKLTDCRKATAAMLKKTIEKELKDLGVAHVLFEARITKKEFSKDGWDAVEFYISPNAGEDLKPLAEIVSSGEAARLMLALKKALTKVDPIPVLIFDEIDAQVGGRLGTVMGTKLKELSSDRQVILITHLPQIASFADRHFKVNKEVTGGKTYTRLALLDGEDKVRELAEMLGASGDKKKSEVSLSHAEEMLAKAQRQ